MKNINRFLATLLVIALLIGMTGMTATAAERAASITFARTADVELPVDTKVFDGYAVMILDKTTPAVYLRGRTNDRTVMCFVAADGRELGVISYSDHWAIIEKYKTMVQLPAGGTLASPPDGYTNWNLWFADEFNKLRGLSAGSRTEAVEAHSAETVEKYRQEVIRLVNAEREKAGLTPYIVNEKCMEYSQIRAKELVTEYSHTRPDGTNAGYEIIFNGPKTPSDAIKGWMNSPGHRAAILNETRVYVGAGCYITSNDTYAWQMYFERDPDVYANTLILG